MTSDRFGDVVVVPFPLSDGVGIKKRPAVIVSPLAYLNHHRRGGFETRPYDAWPTPGMHFGRNDHRRPLAYRHRFDCTLTQIIQQGMAP